MMDLLKQFLSYDKLMKDRLVKAFFFLGLVVIVLSFLGTLLNSFAVMGNGYFLKGLALFLGAFIRIVLLFVGLRLACELMIAIFHINNNLSPDGGKSEMAELDPVEAAREAAAKAAKTATSATKTVVSKTKSRFGDNDEPDSDDVYPDYEDPTPPKRVRKKPATKPAAKTASTTKKTAVKKAPAKKTTTTRKTAAKTTTTKKPAAKKPARKVTPKK